MNGLRWIFGLVLVIHGVGQFLGVLALASIGPDSWNARSWLLTDAIGDGPARVVSTVLWVSALTLFVAAGLAVLGIGAPYTSWRMLAVSGAVLSLIAMALFWDAFPVLIPNKVGSIAVNLTVLIGILITDWPTDPALGVWQG
jgi:hypothetical protein